jgi:hypothetical protein
LLWPRFTNSRKLRSARLEESALEMGPDGCLGRF